MKRKYLLFLLLFSAAISAAQTTDVNGVPGTPVVGLIGGLALPGVTPDGANGIAIAGKAAVSATCPVGTPVGTLCPAPNAGALAARSNTGLTAIFIGTSLTCGEYGSNSSCPTGVPGGRADLTNAGAYTDWPSILLTESTLSGRVTAKYNYAYPGETIAQMTSQYTGGTFSGMSQPHTVAAAAGASCLAFVDAPANDVPLITSSGMLASTEAAESALWALPKADGCTVVAFTMMPRTAAATGTTASVSVPETAANRSWREQYNTWVRTQQQAGSYNVLIDLARFLPDSTDGTNFYDGTHLTTAGYNKEARMINARLWNDGETTPTDLYADDKLNALLDDNFNLHAVDVVAPDTVVSGSYFVLPTDRTLLLTATPGDTNLSGARIIGRRFTFSNRSAGTSKIYDSTTGATLNGAAFTGGSPYVLQHFGDTVTLEFGADSDWKIVGSYVQSVPKFQPFYQATGTYFPTTSDYVDDCNGQAIGLSSAAASGKVLTFVNSSATTCQIESSGSGNINGSSNNYYLPQYASVTFIYNGSQWLTSPGEYRTSYFSGGMGTSGATGTNNLSPTLGSASQVGTGASVSCTTFCNDISGTVTINTGTGTLSAGYVLAIAFNPTWPVAPKCTVTQQGGSTWIGWYTTSTTASTLELYNAVALTASNSYVLTYQCSN